MWPASRPSSPPRADTRQRRSRTGSSLRRTILVRRAKTRGTATDVSTFSPAPGKAHRKSKRPARKRGPFYFLPTFTPDYMRAYVVVEITIHDPETYDRYKTM